MDGTSLPTFKQALIAALEARSGLAEAKVSYGSPTIATDLKTDAGVLDAIWWDDNGESTEEVAVLVAGPEWFDEEYTLTMVVQSMRPISTGTQQVVDARATEMLGEVIGTLASDPNVGMIDTSQILMFNALPSGWKYESGTMPSGIGTGARFMVDIGVNARLKLS